MGLENYKPIIVMVGCQFLYAGVALTGREALLQNFSSRVFVVYRQFTVFLLIAPFAFFSRYANACAMTWKSFFLISLLSFIGVTFSQNLYYEGLYLSSSSAASALGNAVPAITFTIAYFLGLEKVNLRNVRSLCKNLGTTGLCVSGAVVMAVLKGPKLINMELLPKKFNWRRKQMVDLFLQAQLWVILQVYVTAHYPDNLSLTAWMCLIAAVQSAILTFIVEPDLNYAGVASALTFLGQAWCIGMRGPLFSAMFNPLCTVQSLPSFSCMKSLYIGSLTGGLAVINWIVCGGAMGGKAKDYEEIKEEDTTTKKHQNNVNGQYEAITSVDLEQPLLSHN
ncbi:WAT1-related protein At4g30420-like [Salvia splendens]|uniref:WAT1-related protein At4g30420-like n=1 Tax=Salvia splendens TaxID=180675 RepID=UPI001C2740DB|nr:WAT1-related protein At4g30420-like [Salvia splendens]